MLGNLNDIMTPLIVAGVVSVGAAVVDNQTQNRLLEDNIKATQKLTESVIELNTKIAVFEKTYVTKDEFREVENHGS